MRKILSIFLFSILLCSLYTNILATDKVYQGYIKSLFDETYTNGQVGDTTITLTKDDYGKYLLTFYFDTLSYCYGTFPRVSIFNFPSDSGALQTPPQVIFPYANGVIDTLLDSLLAPGVWYGMKLDTLAAAKYQAFGFHMDSVKNDTSVYYFKSNLVKK